MQVITDFEDHNWFYCYPENYGVTKALQFLIGMQILVHYTTSPEIVPLHVAMVIGLCLERWRHHAIRRFDYATD